MFQKRTLLWREAHLEVYMLKTQRVQSTFGSSDDEKVNGVVARSMFLSQHAKSTTCSDNFWTFNRHFVWQAQRIPHLAKSEQNVGVFETAGVGHLKRICNDEFCVEGAIQETSSSKMLGGQGADFLTGCILEHQVLRFAKVILRDRCSTLNDVASLFRGRCNTVERRNAKIAKRIGTMPALHSTFHILRKSRKIATSRPCKLFLLGFETATWHVFGSLKRIKSLKSSKPFAAAFEGSSIRHHGTSLGIPRPHKLFLLDFETATWHVLTPFSSVKSSKLSAEACVAWIVSPPVPALASKYAASRPCKPWRVFGTFESFKSLKRSKGNLEKLQKFKTINRSLLWHLSTLLLGPANCFYWVSKLLRGMFSAPLKASTASKAQNPPLQLSNAPVYSTMVRP